MYNWPQIRNRTRALRGVRLSCDFLICMIMIILHRILSKLHITSTACRKFYKTGSHWGRPMM